MEPLIKKRPNRRKVPIKGMIPVKRWLSLAEACAYLDMSLNIFQNLASDEHLTLSVIGKKKYFKVAELEELIEQRILRRKI